MITAEEIMRCLKYEHNLSEDDKQELAIQLWIKREQYDSSIASVSAWVKKSALNYFLQLNRKKKNVDELAVPISNFDREDTDGNLKNKILDSLADSTMIDDQEAHTSENIQSALILLEKVLSDDEIEFVKKILDGEEVFLKKTEGKSSTNRVKFKRILDKINNGNISKRYILMNIKSGEKHYVTNFREAAEICEYTAARCSDSFKRNILFGGKWKINKIYSN